MFGSSCAADWVDMMGDTYSEYCDMWDEFNDALPYDDEDCLDF